ncbi:hypothetical protein BDQ12DRAFT_678636 [Crucibulum laeve]|uniref:Uncharacterized protein n=1 Tax=Crucibulum laeve TaxID=68775 RepID=A0A5C3M668_9AGAR|nr:hypothetical protein BDQ12DRAFT_678636 [Crucibulum laeve]
MRMENVVPWCAIVCLSASAVRLCRLSGLAILSLRATHTRDQIKVILLVVPQGSHLLTLNGRNTYIYKIPASRLTEALLQFWGTNRAPFSLNLSAGLLSLCCI